MSSLYLHVPFCRRKCIYCDFYSVGERLADRESLVRKYLEEFDARRHEIPLPAKTLYFGGGTPSLMPVEQLSALVEALSARGAIGESTTERTIEINPDDVTEDKAVAWSRLGFNRFSIGVQSFDDTLLRTIGRRHDAASARRAVETLRPLGDVSLDLIFALPGQTMQQWRQTVAEAVALRPQHISAYALMYEEGTPLTRLRDNGTIREADDDIYLEMFSYLTDTLAAAGYRQYEISNYALPGHESRHNSAYWDGTPYLGLGPAAHSYDGRRTRRANPADIRRYLKHNFITPFFNQETLTDRELAEEYLLTRLRTARGIDLSDFQRRFPSLSADLLTRPLPTPDLVAIENNRLHLTRAGIMTRPRPAPVGTRRIRSGRIRSAGFQPA